jgi:hypothetical protein
LLTEFGRPARTFIKEENGGLIKPHYHYRMKGAVHGTVPVAAQENSA